MTVCLILGLVFLRLFWGFEAHRRLRAELDRYQAAGQPIHTIDFDEQLDAVPDDENAAVLLEKAIKTLTMVTSSGASISDFVVDPQLFVTQNSDATELFEANKPVLAMIHLARSKPRVAWSERLRDSAAWRFRSTLGAGQRDLSRLLWFAATYQRQNRDDEGRIQTIHDFVIECETIESHPTLIANLVAGATYGLAFSLIEDATVGLQIEPINSGWWRSGRAASRNQMEDLLNTLVDESRFRRAAIDSRYGERAQHLARIESIDRVGRFGVFAKSTWHAKAWDQLVGTAQRPLFVLDTIRAVQESTLASDAIGESCWPNAEQLIPEVPVRRSLLRSMTQPLTDHPFMDQRGSTRRHVQHHFRDLASRRMAATAIAILLFEKDHGRRPKALTELVPDYLSHVSADPFTDDDASIRYRPNADHPVLYSVGLNGRDDQGQEARDANGRFNVATSDILFNLSGRRPRGGN